MFVIFLKFSENKNQAPDFMQAHQDWIKRGFDDGVFLIVGSLQPNMGGAILAHNTSLEELQQRINNDPFVSEKIVTTEVSEISPNQADTRLDFLLS